METMNRKIGNKATAVFFGIVIVLSAIIETLICLGGPE